MAGTLFTALQVTPAPAVAQDPILVLRTESEYQRLDDRYTLRMRAFGISAALRPWCHADRSVQKQTDGALQQKVPGYVGGELRS